MQHKVRRPKTKQSSSGLHKNTLQNVPVNVMAKFVRQHRLDFLGSVVIQQSIGKDDAPRIAQSGQSGIRFLALLRKLPAVDSANPRAGVFAQYDQPSPQVFILERLELVKDWE